MIGTNFQPQPLNPSGGALQKKPSADAGVQEAIKVLSLRLPKVVGAQSMAPGALLNAQGARGDSRIDAIVNRVLQQYLPTEKPPMGQAPTVPPVLGQPGPGESGPMPPSPPVRMPDPSANPYLAFAAMLMAGLDGIQNKIKPPAPLDKDIYELSEAEKKAIRGTPGSLEETLNALEADHAFMLKGDVFTKDVIETWIELKRKREIDQIRLRPHPHEFFMYYDV